MIKKESECVKISKSVQTDDKYDNTSENDNVILIKFEYYILD